ncbi:MAG: hypothetical protein DI603_13455 [Roseateles depolymerans]|uniref:Uncharacterized protein n=1 Tax=Roseateles depolymerans TaxID=76731 RepID=A0A2W5FDV6_9BURK|nr:MAG: hypothetical protein DI603_13455 [Roseateles depolymerans]
MSARRWLQGLLLAVVGWLAGAAQAEPYLAIRYGLKCAACHVNPTGGGLRNAVGNAFAQGSIPANALPEALQGWTGGFFGDRLRVGGDWRSAQTDTRVSGQPTQRATGTEQGRLYADVQVLADYLGVYVDEAVAPGKAERMESYARLSTPGMGWYAKLGQFYLPFGWRLQDNTAFVRQVSGISMTVPDKGVELGMEQGDWTAQLVYSRGPGNKGTVTGHQWTGNVAWLQSWGRLGFSTAQVTSTGGSRQAYGFYGGTTTGPVAWLGEVDLVSDSGFPEGRRRLMSGLLEANWLVRQGHNLKISSEYFDPDRSVSNDQKMRYSLVYEYTPIAFLQLRGGVRHYDGIPQNKFDNRRQTFVELHGLF